MWHHRCSNDANADVEHVLILNNFRAGNETQHHSGEIWLGKEKFRCKTTADGRDQGDYQSLDATEPLALQIQHGEHICGRDGATPNQRYAKEQLQGDGRADDFRQITGGDGDFGENPEKPDDRRRIMVAAGLRQIASGGDTELDGQMLEQNRHEI